MGGMAQFLRILIQTEVSKTFYIQNGNIIILIIINVESFSKAFSFPKNCSLFVIKVQPLPPFGKVIETTKFYLIKIGITLHPILFPCCYVSSTGIVHWNPTNNWHNKRRFQQLKNEHYDADVLCYAASSSHCTRDDNERFYVVILTSLWVQRYQKEKYIYNNEILLYGKGHSNFMWSLVKHLNSILWKR